ncbi:aldehyde dehydrogenase (NADP(+)) [Paraburkholderia nemoris]|uniref:Alpha-ketoglutaric semialdehyde dehydrogenase 2 n=1 Tax=Paraburkholderia nemoris TaxID=2793076 RepID=A0ABN7N1L5_9BURK|nr:MULTISPECIES: aldehyde dehydrogenase (NADP(+)) [Paraburkholderia]MBK3815198.1 aldehyde dehydrogenase (NADP(+)) [Paraburkholderia aspalathi]CAE6713533.1 Alpha-ketoglutaric semialdehyde dehydrogenase 2 [Paraburkholderia nemoris]CAE6839368.1 Alpha-ketoglutaric semialdehyde dehydrogenase 2 [Paraburkholderia nemoris]
MTDLTRITGEMPIGASMVHGEGGCFRALDPATGEVLEPAFGSAQESDVARACELARLAFDSYRNTTPDVRANFLEAIAENIVALGETLVQRACAETGLPRARIEGERGRTVAQLRLFASRVRVGDGIDARIDPAFPERQPLPRADIRMQRIAVGPVAVFGASNFPLAFSVAGGDTASALAVGCPVVVKAHPAHPGTSELVGRTIQAAVRANGLPEGVFSLLFDDGFVVGAALVAHPAIKAVGFTGSRRGGVALMKIAAARAEPIPVYAEMSSVNPVFLLPAALAARGKELAIGFVESLTLGVGQFCTNPGLVLGVAGAAFEQFKEDAAVLLTTRSASVMLTPGIAAAYASGIDRLNDHPVARAAGRGEGEGDGCAASARAQAALYAVDADNLLADPSLGEEVFGPCSLLVACRDVVQMREVAEYFEGQLTATLQFDEADDNAARTLLPVLERKAGRIVANGWPTGVEVCDAMVHGGPYPATSDGRSTSVGTAAIERFLRPVCYQNLPQTLLPDALRDANPLCLPRRVDGVLAGSESVTEAG